MQKSFAEALINRDDHVCYGRKLHDFCLYDLLFLALDQNAAYFGDNPTQEDLLAAVLICSSDHKDLLRGRHSIEGWRKKWFIRKAMFTPFAPELAKFKAYISDFDQRPEFFTEGGGSSLKAPAVLSVASFIEKHSNMTQHEIMSAPIGLMFWRSATIAEFEGLTTAEIMTQEWIDRNDEVLASREAENNG